MLDYRAGMFSVQHGITRLIGDPRSISRIKLGPGVIGITGTVMVTAMVVAGGVTAALAFAGRADMILEALIIIFAVAILFCAGTYFFAFRQPDLALLSGADLLTLRQAQMAGKDVGEIPLVPPVISPAPPVIEDRHGE